MLQTKEVVDKIKHTFYVQ